jgi:GxxExxY protein
MVGESCLDLLWADRLVVELKAIEVLAPIHWVPVRSYLKAAGCHLGLLIDLNTTPPPGRSASDSHRIPWRPVVLALK